MVYNTGTILETEPFSLWSASGIFFVNQPEKHRKIYFVVCSIHSYPFKCFDVNLQIDITDKENVALIGFKIFMVFKYFSML